MERGLEKTTTEEKAAVTSDSSTNAASEEANADSLVIDEEKNADDDEKEFEPTVDMIMNEFDDEQTIDEEEELGQEDQQEEINDLEKEQDMPIEELLKLYGYTKPPEGESEKGDEDITEEEPKNAEEESTALVDTQDDLKKDERIESDQESEIRGEKRSFSVLPPSKKPRSELAKFYEASVEGRSLRSSGGVQEEDDEESEEEPEEGKDFSWKKTIMIGPSFQATVPSGLSNYDDTLPYENEDKQLWDPTRLSEEVAKEYLAKSAETIGPNAALGVHAIPNGSHIRDDEQALYLLLQCGYNQEEALRRKRMNAVPPADTMSLWSEEECRAFETGLRVYGKDFYSIQSQKVGTRSVGELVQFYYLWKKTERHDVFANSFRIEKKKYTLHPGTTDYMERFMDEQETGRDRSVSPNYHSLIYGDNKRKADGKQEVNGDKEKLSDLPLAAE